MNRFLNRLVTFALVAIPGAAFAAEHGSGESGEGSGGLLQTLGIEPKGLIVQICGFLLLFLLLKKFLFGPLQSAMATRRGDIQHNYDQIAAQQAEVAQKQADLEQRLVGIENEARERITTAATEAKALQESLLAEARQQADRIMEQGRQMVKMEQDKALVTLRQEVADLAVRAAGQIIDANMNDDRNRHLVDDFINRVGS